MKKRIPIYHYICLGMVIGSLFLPWTKFDLYSGGIFKSHTLVETGLLESGLAYEGVYFVVGIMLLISAIVLAIRNIATGIIGLVLAFGLLVYMPLLGMGLTFSLFGSHRNIDLQLGYYVSLLSVIAYLGFTIWNLVYVARANKKETRKMVAGDLLDDF